MSITPHTFASVDELVARRGRSIVYKHSPSCELSSWAHHVLGKLAAQEGLTLELVDVLGERPLSQAIESTFGVRHESPQLLIIEDGDVRWHASHRGLRPERVLAALAGSAEGLGARL